VHFVGLFLSSLLKMHGPKKIKLPNLSNMKTVDMKVYCIIRNS